MSSGRSPAYPDLALLLRLDCAIIFKLCSAVQCVARFFSMTCLTSDLLLSEQTYAHETAEC